MTENAIIPVQPSARQVADLATYIRQSIVAIRQDVLKPGVDYGKIPGTSKDVLLKPGAEKLSSGFKLYPMPKLLTCVEDWRDGFFFYRYQIDMVHRETGEVWGIGIGSCNSREKKYAWRWVNADELPEGMDTAGLMKQSGMRTQGEFEFAIDKAEAGGKYGKPTEYWQAFKDAIASGKAKKSMKDTKNGTRPYFEITSGSTQYRLPNPEICDLVNTIDKMAFKRAYVAAVLIATNASEFFTQDMEDFANLALPDEDVIEGQIEDTPPVVTPPTEDKKPEPTAPKWYEEENGRALQSLSARAFGSGLIKERNGKGIAEMEAMIAPRTWGDFADLATAASVIKAIVEGRRAQAAPAITIATPEETAAITGLTKSPEPALTGEAFKLATGGVSPLAASAGKSGTSSKPTSAAGRALDTYYQSPEDERRAAVTNDEIDAMFDRAATQ